VKHPNVGLVLFTSVFSWFSHIVDGVERGRETRMVIYHSDIYQMDDHFVPKIMTFARF